MSEYSSDVSARSKKAKRRRDVFDQLHDHPVCDIPATGNEDVDVMAVYRPKRKDMTRVKDYDLTQAYTVMDRDPVKIRVRDTTCELTFHPPGFGLEAKMNNPCMHGPIEKFLMEEYMDIIECYQSIAHESLKQRKIARIRKAKEAKRRVARAFTGAVGPDWFQELSNPQRAAVDRLAKAIITDLNCGTIEKTQVILAQLGLVLRPNHVHVKKALQLCASCPVEFLLVLYQITNPDRSRYSINDRLLLSAVIHLTIRSTLRELHVRIPSPPRVHVKPPRPKKIPKKPCSSPYLQNLLLPDKRDYPCYHGPNRFYASNEYFNYIDQMRCDSILLRARAEGDTTRDFQYEKTYTGGVCTCDNCCFPDCQAVKDLDEYTRIEIDLITEWTKAQKYYNSLVNTDYVPALIKPSVYICPIGQFRPHPVPKALMAPHNSLEILRSKSNIISKKDAKICACKTQSSLKAIASEHRPSQSSPNLKSTATVSKVTFASDEPECICSISSSDHVAVCEEGEGWCDESSIQQAPPGLCDLPCTVRDYEVGPLLEVKTVDSETCACKEAILRRIDESLCHCPRCEDDRRRANSYVKYVVDNMKEIDEEETIPIVKDLKVTPICTCMEKYKKRWEKFERTRGVRKVQEALKSLDEKFVIQGTAVGPDGKIVYILNSVQPQRCCQCARLKQIAEEEKEILKRMPMLPGGCIKYHIQGVQARPEGNVYIVGGTTENVDCHCMELFTRFTDEHSICLKLYDEYMKKIAYDTEEYLKEVDPKYCDFTASATWTETEVEVHERSCTCHLDRGTQMCCCTCDCMDSDLADQIDCVCSVTSCPCGVDLCECVTEEGTVTDESLFEGVGECVCTPTTLSLQEEGVDTTNCACSTFDDNVSNKTSTTPTTTTMKSSPRKSVSIKDSLTKDPKGNTTDGPQKVNDDDEFMDKVKESYKKHPLYQDEDPPILERYMIFKELPSSERQQMAVTKTALKKLAEDGFPLARLPGVHNLPIFKTWWRYRLRTFYTPEERYRMLHVVDQIVLQLVDHLAVSPPPVTTNFLRDKKWMQNYDYHSIIKSHNLMERTNYQRILKEIGINNARNIYTLMRQYGFPSKTFRDVFFAYMPSKEEDILVDQIWKASEHKRIQTTRRCL